jgi:hypothetical protein
MTAFLDKLHYTRDQSSEKGRIRVATSQKRIGGPSTAKAKLISLAHAHLVRRGVELPCTYAPDVDKSFHLTVAGLDY